MPTEGRPVKAVVSQWSCDASSEVSLRHVAFTTPLKAEDRRTSVLSTRKSTACPQTPHARPTESGSQGRAHGQEPGEQRQRGGRSRQHLLSCLMDSIPQRRLPPGKCVSPAGFPQGTAWAHTSTDSLGSGWWPPARRRVLIKASVCRVIYRCES